MGKDGERCRGVKVMQGTPSHPSFSSRGSAVLVRSRLALASELRTYKARFYNLISSKSVVILITVCVKSVPTSSKTESIA